MEESVNIPQSLLLLYLDSKRSRSRQCGMLRKHDGSAQAPAT